MDKLELLRVFVLGQLIASESFILASKRQFEALSGSSSEASELLLAFVEALQAMRSDWMTTCFPRGQADGFEPDTGLSPSVN